MATTSDKHETPDPEQKFVDDVARLAGSLVLLFGGRPKGQQPGSEQGTAQDSEARTPSDVELRLLKTALGAGGSVISTVFTEVTRELGSELRQVWDEIKAELDAEIAARREPTEES